MKKKNTASNTMESDCIVSRDNPNYSRRDFLRTATVVAGGTALAAGTNLTAKADQIQKVATTTTKHTGHAMTEYGSMMFMQNHSMKSGQVIEPPGSPSPNDVNYRVFDVDVRIVEHEILPGIKMHVFGFNGQVPGPEFHVNEGDTPFDCVSIAYNFWLKPSCIKLFF